MSEEHTLFETAQQEQAEEWKPAPGFEDCYSVSNLGRVARTAARGGKSTFQLKATSTGWSGYPTVYLWRHGKHHAVLVHRLVAMAFIEKPEADCNEVNHKDGNKGNCEWTNLEWVTRSQNNQHAIDTGLRVIGETHHFARLSKDSVLEIKRLLPSCTNSQLAERFNVSPETIGRIRNGRTWKLIS